MGNEHKTKVSAAAFALLLLLCLPGCRDGSVGRVRGVVTYDGAPVQGLEVEFNPVGEGRSSIGFTDQQGHYELQYTLQKKGALVGEHKVRVSIPPGADLGFRIPPQYGGKSELVCQVAPGANTFDITMSGSR